MPVVRLSDNEAERTRDGKQLYKCMACGRQFRAGETMTDKELWRLYQSNKQTITELAVIAGKSPSTIKRRLRRIVIEWEQPSLNGTGGFVHLEISLSLLQNFLKS